MIFPFLKGILSFRVAPVTWILCLINFSMFVFVTAPSLRSHKEVEKKLFDTGFLNTQGRYFAEFVVDHKDSYPPLVVDLSESALEKGEKEGFNVLGGIALRDKQFLKMGVNKRYQGDQVANQRWVASFEEVEQVKSLHPSYSFGVSSEGLEEERWFSYQFVHSGLFHLLANMTFLLIFGSMLEPIIGGLAILMVYLGGGFVAASIFLLVTGLSPVPLIGASGAVSALMALFCVIYWKKPVAYFYFLFIPRPGYWGFVYLPAWLTLVLWVISDLAGLIGTVAEFGGVAHSAHLGGQLAGVMVGLGLYAFHRWNGSWADLEEKMSLEFPVGHKITIGPPQVEKRETILGRIK